ncbi:hypothetical protein V2J09_010443 [Rumex salicifolius]
MAAHPIEVPSLKTIKSTNNPELPKKTLHTTPPKTRSSQGRRATPHIGQFCSEDDDDSDESNDEDGESIKDEVLGHLRVHPPQVARHLRVHLLSKEVLKVEMRSDGNCNLSQPSNGSPHITSQLDMASGRGKKTYHPARPPG